MSRILKELKVYFRKLREKARIMYTRDILDLMEFDPGSRLLDIGCDDGEWTKQVAGRVGTKDVYGIEIMQEAAAKSKLNGIKVFAGNISSGLPVRDGAFDAVHSNQVIEHLSATEHFVKEIYRVIKPGGYAVICTENLSSWHNIFSLVMGWMPMSSSNFSETIYNVGNPLAMRAGEEADYPVSWQHIRVLSVRGIKEIFELHGFKTEKILGAGYYPFPPFFARIDKVHAAFMTCKFRKPVT
ncbi:MAG: class I SAM-dependent methyltransferase [Syntrophobacteraceae bacterium]